MNVLVYSDFHGNLESLRYLLSLNLDYDLFIIPGDISIFEKDMIRILNQISQFKKVLIIPGNHEDRLNVDRYDNIHNINKSFYDKGDYRFLGLGHGGFSEFEPNAKILKPYIEKNKTNILITHAPPYNTKIDLLDKIHVGNKTITRSIKKYNFPFVFCGHIHETEGQIDKIKNTTILNCGIPFLVDLKNNTYEKILF
ncbi:MAG: metallophosphoesterase family protein [Candidatus Woesearchaeota archaeon]